MTQKSNHVLNKFPLHKLPQALLNFLYFAVSKKRNKFPILHFFVETAKQL